MKYRQVAGKLTVLGCHELLRKGGGSHRKWFNPSNLNSPALAAGFADFCHALLNSNEFLFVE